MKRIFTHFIRTIFLLFFFVTSLYGQDYSASVIASNGPFSALTKDRDGNIYAIKATSGTTAAVVKYAKGTTTEQVIYNGLTRDAFTYPWGLAISSLGDIYVSKSFDDNISKVIKLTKATNYVASDFLTANNYYTGLAIDANDNLYTLQYNATSTKYEVVRYNQLATTSPTVLYTGINSQEGLTYPTGLVVSNNGEVHFTEPMSNDGTNTNKGGVTKITSGTTTLAISSEKYTTALTFDAQNNLFALEGNGSNSDYRIFKYTNGVGTGTALSVENDTKAKSSDFVYPWGIVTDNNTIYYLDGDNGIDGGKLMKLTRLNLPPTLETDDELPSFVESETGNPTPVVIDPSIRIVYDNAPTITSAKIKISDNLVTDEDMLSFIGNVTLYGNMSGIYDGTLGELELTSSSSTVQQWQAALRSVGYLNTSSNPTTDNRTVSFQLIGQDYQTNVITKILSVIATNNAPTITTSLTSVDNTDYSYVFATVNSNGISISDVDAGSNNVKISLSVNSLSKLTLSTVTGLTFTTGGGIDDSTIVAEGTIQAINTALNGLTYNLTSNYPSEDELVIVVNDLGNTGDGGAKEDTITLPISNTPAPRVIEVTSSNNDGTYGVGEVIQINVGFNQDVLVTGSPVLELETGDVKRNAIYKGVENNIVRFEYTVEVGDVSADLDYTSSNALSEGSITSTTNNVAADLLLPIPGEVGSLGYNKSIVINTSSTTVWENGTWSNGMPDFSKDAILREPYEGDILANKLTFETDIVVKTGTTYTIYGAVINNSNQVTFENEAYLVQIDDNTATNIGDITFKVNSKPIYKSDIMDWSSPVSNQNILALSPDTLPSTFSRFVEAQNNWVNNVTPTDVFNPMEAISFAAPNNFNTYGQGEARVFEAIFKGTPLNKVYAQILIKSNKGYNAVGNPYPSPIDLTKLMQLNNNTVSNVFTWSTNQANVNGKYVSGNWNSYNRNLGWNDPSVDNTLIGVGQGFIVKNELQVTPLFINNFVRAAVMPLVKESAVDDDKFWLTLESDTNTINSTLVGYKNGSTKELDADFDTEPFMADYGIFSVLDDKIMSIQGRGDVFDANDRFNLAVQLPSMGNYTIKLSKTSGLFASGQSVYLLDRETNSGVDLTKQDYNFVANEGNNQNRFEILFDDESLNTSDLTKFKDVIVYNERNSIVVKSNKEKLKTIKIYNLNGELIKNVTDINTLQKTINTNLNAQVLIVQIELVNGSKLSKKVLIKN
ncbi:hypothetical protein SAMN05443634_11166 [Chishuiella changwenlii]|uniref:Por secretion system C-terminal sorting domain-containing protein n=1 Tax=Chishuiella changwenlii TaxID=1434701 RepID=A0A1M7BNL9_9FLAO|nr:hypothetical protein [Chishuiella changwenlii]GGF03030.1 hypothetical protein GCM10010984_20590 [Chishuiella changwenlii]SHL56456.1 hypothetical protein SAMN05443634_11166 [Chishuiella changwenlii]